MQLALWIDTLVAQQNRETLSGRSEIVDNSGQAFQLAIQLPEETKLIHEIKTDDPVGIEEYWHKRFRGRRPSR